MIGQCRGAQENEVEAEQAISIVAKETQVKQTFDWNRYSSFNEIRNFIAYCMKFKTKEKGPLKAEEIHQAEQILFRFVQTESFPNVSKSITNSKEISNTLNAAKLSPFIEEDGTIRVKGRLKHSNLAYNAKYPILLTAKHPVVQLLLERLHRDNLHEGTEYVRNMLQQKYWIIGVKNAIQKKQVKMYQMQTQERQPNSPTDGGVPIHSYRSQLLRTLLSQVSTTYHEEINGAASSLARQREQYTSKSHSHWTPSHV